MLGNCFKLLRTTSNSSNLLVARNYAFKSELKIKWNRPEKISCIKPEKSGDLKKLENVDQSRFMLGFEKSEEMKDANDIVKSLFVLENNPRKNSMEIARKEMIDSVKRHDLDLGSMESKLAKMTVQIRAMQEYMEEFPRNKVVKVQLKEMIDKRKRFLRYLRRWDYRRFEWVLEKLDLVYKPYPTKFHWITRKDSLRKLTDIHCDNIRETRLEEYKKLLESQQLEFLSEKIKNLEFVQNEQKECKVPVTVNPEEIQLVKVQYEELKKKRQVEAEANKKISKETEYNFDLLK